ncbi:SUKH-4 family immunity protein [Streptomyces sp. NPDC004435]|uniref:SUKH-4 family immunity protein n=1 Tax=Streptomyces sp. NPDC004435 TaxID=3364701 RepID=UPI0036BFC156
MGTAPDECRNWLVLSMSADTTLGLDPDSGTVYALGDGSTHMTHRPLHRDVESPVYAITAFENLRRALEEDDEERVDDLRARITVFDALPFADEDPQ